MKKITIEQLFEKENFPQYEVSLGLQKKIANIPFAWAKTSLLARVKMQYKTIVVVLFVLILGVVAYISLKEDQPAPNTKVADNTDQIVKDIDDQVDKMLGTVDYGSRIDLENSNYYQELVPEY